MGFIGVYRAIYDYEAQVAGELALSEGDVLFVLDKTTGDDGWWKAKKKAVGGDDEEPEGLIPNNYIEEAQPTAHARALYEYQRQTDEELSFVEDAVLEVYDTTDPDWTLVGLEGEYGFAPANYIDAGKPEEDAAPPMPVRPQSQTLAGSAAQSYPSPAASPVQTPAAALASIIQQKTGSSSHDVGRSFTAPTAAQFTPEASDEEPPPRMPQRPASQQMSPPPSASFSTRSPALQSPGIMPSPSIDQGAGYHMYNIHEMISHMGKNKKMPTTLGLNAVKGTIMIAPERSKDGPQNEWSAEQLTHYSLEGKHVFMELVRPSKSIDFHAGAKDTAKEIVAMLGELAGAARAAGLREVIAATSGAGQKKGKMLYEFMAQGDDEVTVAVDDEVLVLDDSQSEEWWMVRRLKNGKEGVVPASYVELTGVVAAEPAPTMASAPTVTSIASPAPVIAPTQTSREARREASRREEERLAREAVKSNPVQEGSSSKRSRKQSQSSAKPDASRIRTWTDRSGSFKVEAQFLGLKDNKINLHKTNGVKIAVDVGKMSVEDIEYVERETGRSLDEDKPLSEIRRKNTQRRNERNSRGDGRANKDVPPATAQTQKKPEYEWFDFFLQCGVNPQICERYASAFSRDQMGEENLRDISPTLLRTLGLKEGDILRVMKHLDEKFDRSGAATNGTAGNEEGGLFSGPGGALRNNTRKGRPAPTVQNNDTVDPRAFEQDSIRSTQAAETSSAAARPSQTQGATNGFDDDAWDVRPSRPAGLVRVSSLQSQPPVQAPALTGAMSELSLLDAPLIPTPAPRPQSQPQPPPPQQPQATGADPSFFDRLSQPQSRARPLAPQQSAQTSLLPPPPQRPISAPQNQQNSAYAPPPLRPQMTGNLQQLAPPGQSLAELNQQRAMSQMYPQQTGYMYPQQTGFAQMSQMNYQPTGYNPQQQLMNGQMNGSPFADPPRAPFQPLQPQQTGYQPMLPQATGINNFLPPALQPQRTGFNPQQTNGYQQPQPTGFQPNGFQQTNGLQQTNGFQPNGLSQSNGMQSQPTGFGQSFGPTALQPQITGFGQPAQSFQPPPMPPMPQNFQTPAPLQPQKTGPPPPIRFGTANKLTPQPTGRRANLSSATPQNPFGF